MKCRSADSPPPVPRSGPWSAASLRLKLLLGAALVLCSMTLGVQAANAHPWYPYHWNRSGSAVYIYTYNTASLYSPINAARLDIQARPHPVYLPAVSYHTDVSILDCYCGATGWGGL